MPAAAEWTRRPERGSLPVLRFGAWLSLTVGRTASRLVLRGVAPYFLATGGTARRSAAAFLARVQGRKATVAELYRLFFAFASVTHDRVFFLRNRFDLFDVHVTGAELFGSEGVLLMGGHVGSFEALRACGRELGKRQVAMAMYEANARRIQDVLAAINPDMKDDVVALGQPQSMIELASRLERGALVGMLADRTLGEEPSLEVPFFGTNAAFPTGPMRVAAALRARVLFMVGLYRGGNRYDVRFEPLADFTNLEGLSREQRDARVRDAVVAYAARLEQTARGTPDNWFNFHDFWGTTR